jgi:rhodanese-related sulfurtransferase
MKLHLYYILIFLIAFSSNAQNSLSKLLNQYNDKSIPYISVQELAMPKTIAVILDTRELNEYETSHIKNAIYAGYDYFEIDSLQQKIPNKGQNIVVYCSLGIRSETIAKKLKKAGYTNVFNLYGGIFEWKNKGFKVYNSEEEETENVHAFSKEWSKWLTKGIKIYD